MILTEKQKDIIASKSRYNIFDGAVRCGKTFASLLLLPLRIKQFKDTKGEMLIVGKTERTIYRNIIIPLQQMFGDNYVSNPNYRGETYLFGNRIFIVGANDEKASDKIRGMSLKHCYIDEATLLPQSFFEMLKSRLSSEDAICDCTMNADSPYHWFKKEIIDNPAISKTRINFQLKDGQPFLSKQYYENIQKEYSGVYYKRYILGQWCVAEGTIFDMFDFEKNVFCEELSSEELSSEGQSPKEQGSPKPPFRVDYYITSCDYGTSSVLTFGLFGVNEKEKKIALVKQYYYDAKKRQKQKTNDEYVSDYSNFVYGYNVKYGYVDPSASSLILQLRRSGFSYIRAAKNDVSEGIRFMANLIGRRQYLIHKSCVEAIREMGSYCWDSLAQKHGMDRPLKRDDHSSDMQRYAIYSHLTRLY
jgi:phage terminase large subunit